MIWRKVLFLVCMIMVFASCSDLDTHLEGKYEVWIHCSQKTPESAYNGTKKYVDGITIRDGQIIIIQKIGNYDPRVIVLSATNCHVETQ